MENATRTFIQSRHREMAKQIDAACNLVFSVDRLEYMQMMESDIT